MGDLGTNVSAASYCDISEGSAARTFCDAIVQHSGALEYCKRKEEQYVQEMKWLNSCTDMRFHNTEGALWPLKSGRPDRFRRHAEGRVC